MSRLLDASLLQSFRAPLDNHPVYAAVASLEDLQCFMQHHVYSVWDFMSLIKYLQGVIAPTSTPWVARGDAAVRRFINELVLEEESDTTHVEGEFSSHFELYLRAMQEIGADSQVARHFVQTAGQDGMEAALALPRIPAPSAAFTRQTFAFIQADKPHQVAAALALGREHIIPNMFRAILARTGVSAEQAPIFHFYLNRHIHLDEDFHAPLSLRLLNSLCAGDEAKIDEAMQAAQLAVQARLALWDGVLGALQRR
ncbi:MAG: DUF3050 domain-containing protein [Thiolinea sp.]